MGEAGESIAPEDRNYKSVFHPETREILHPNPVIILPGIGETAEGSLRDFTQAFADLGHPAYAITHREPRIDKNFLERSRAMAASEWKKQYTDIISGKEADALFASMPVRNFRKARDTTELIDEVVESSTRSMQVDLIGHSAGSVDVLFAALMRPDRVRRLVLLNPAGQTGKENAAALILKFHYSLGTEWKKVGMRGHVSDTFRTLIGRGMYMESVREGIFLAGFDGRPHLEALTKIAPEMRKKIDFGEDDLLFKADKIRAAAKAALAHSAHPERLAEWEQISGGHYNFIRDPETHAKRLSAFLIKD